MIDYDKDKLIMSVVKCMAIMKIDRKEIVNDCFSVKKMGNYRKILLEDIKMKIIEFETFDEIIVYSTGKTEINKDFIDEAKEVCRVMGWDWDFEIYENDEPDHPMIFINGEDIAFFIAPRDRNWFKGKTLAKGFQYLDNYSDEPKEEKCKWDVECGKEGHLCNYHKNLIEPKEVKEDGELR